MLPTLFHIPLEVGGVPLFGVGLLLALWVVGSLILLAWLVRRQGWSTDTFSYLPLLALVAAVIAWVLPALADSDGVPIRGYGVMMLLAVAAGAALAVCRARRVGLDPERIYSLAFWMFLSGIVGARLFYVVEYWDKFQKPSLSATLTAVVNVTEGGLVVYGSLLGALVAFLACCGKQRLPLLATADLIAPSLTLGLALGRVGCFLNGCCFGGPCDLPWAVRFPADSPPHARQIEQGAVYGIQLVGVPDRAGQPPAPVVAVVAPDSAAAAQGLSPGVRVLKINHQSVATLADASAALWEAFHLRQPLVVQTDAGQATLEPLPGTIEHSRPIHPTQLYSALNALLITGVLLAWWPHRRRDGELTALLFTLYPITRFLIEIIRIDEPSVFGTGLSISQNISLAVLAGAVLLWVVLWRRPPSLAWPAAAGAAA